MMAQEYRSLVAFVRQVQQRLTLRRLLQRSLLFLTACLALLLLGTGIQLLLPAVPLLAPLYSLLTLSIVGYVLMYGLIPALRLVSLRHTLTQIETAYPDLHDDLTNALQLDPSALEQVNPHGVALDLVQALHQQTAQQVQHYTVPSVVRQQHLVGLPWCALLGLATVLLAVLQPHVLGTSLHILLHPFSYLPSREIHIALTPERATIALGMNFEVRAQARGRLPQTMQVLVTRAGQAEKRYPMEALGEGLFRYTFLKPQTSLTFQAMADGFTSTVGHLDVVPAPAIGHMVLHYVFPDYTGLPGRTQEGGGDIQALPGTQVQLRMRSNVPLTKGVLRFDTGQEVPLQIHEQELRGEMLVMREGTYTIAVEDTHGLTNTQAPRYVVHILPDATPRVTIRQPQDGIAVDEATTLQIQYDAEDDFGLQDAALVYSSANTSAQRIPLRQGRFAQRQVQEAFVWDMNQWPLPSGETVQMYIEVYDNDTISGPKKGVSQTLNLKVHSREQEHQQLE
ncbi:MAG: DUF4175 domain-containing protein, partial [Candidatus Tectomicrobia bacterium]|nr:DUF4175 domain-containing protein [Candidatus Tectomicrobia bacterium]